MPINLSPNDLNLHNLLGTCLNFFDQSFKLKLNPHIQKQNKTILDGVCMNILAKSSKTALAIHHLTREGFGEDALTLTRTIFENYTTFAYILKEDSKHRAELFIAHGCLDYHKKLNNKSHPDAQHCIKLLEEEYKQNKKKHTGFEDKHHWTRLKLRKVCELINCSNGYDKIYWALSQQTHPHSISLIGYSDNGAPDDTPNTKMVEEALIYSIELLLMLLRLANETYTCELHNELNILSNKLAELIPIKWAGRDS